MTGDTISAGNERWSPYTMDDDDETSSGMDDSYSLELADE